MRRARSTAAILAVALLAAACSGGGSGKPSGSSTTASSGGGGTLRLAVEKPESLDPAQASPASQGELVIADLLFDGLTSADSSGAVHPSIASGWQPSTDQTKWTFTLRSDATFANGRAVNATDVKYSLQRVAKLGEGSLSAQRLDVIAGWRDYVAGTSGEIVGIKATDPTTVEVDLVTPMSALPVLLSSPVYGIVPQEAVEAASPAFASAPVGSGPFAYAGATGDVVTLKRAPGGAAHLDSVELHLFDSADKAYDAFAAGGLDWAPVPTTKVSDAVSRFGASQFRPFHAEVFYAFNLLDPAFADVRFRQAIIKAIDRAAVVKAVYPDAAVALNGIVPEGVPGHAADACGTPCAHDVDGAKALLAQAFPTGAIPTVHLDYATSPTADAVAGAIETGLTGAGIPVEKRPKAAADYDAFATSGQQGLFQFGWVGLYPDADAYLVPLFAGGSRDNVTGFTNGDVDNALAAARASADPSARASAFAKVETAILAQAPVVPLAQLDARVVVSDRVHDLDVGIGGTFDATKVTVGA